nr:hypothetical protein [Tanacetum cinerariifolium]
MKRFPLPLSLTILSFLSVLMNLLEFFVSLMKVYACILPNGLLHPFQIALILIPTIFPPLKIPKWYVMSFTMRGLPLNAAPLKGKSLFPTLFKWFSEIKLDLKNWETILSENTIILSGNKDHPNVCLVYMLYFLANQKWFNLAYYTAKRMERVIKSDLMVLPYGMLLTRLYRHVLTTQSIAITNIHYLADHVMVPLTEGRAHRFMVDGKRPQSQTSSGSSSSPSPTPTQGEVDPVGNFTLDPVMYSSSIPGGPSEEFKQTKRMFKCFSHFLSNLGKKKR